MAQLDTIIALLNGASRANAQATAESSEKGDSVATQGEGPAADVLAELQQLRAENERLRRQGQQLRLQVSSKGGVSIYGLGRFPTTLYKQQWERLLDFGDEIRFFIQQNAHLLATKKGPSPSE